MVVFLISLLSNEVYDKFVHFRLFCLIYLFINDVLDGCESYGVYEEGKYCCWGVFFADDIVLCASSKNSLKILLKTVYKWAKKNEMPFGNNKCSSIVVKAMDVSKIHYPYF